MDFPQTFSVTPSIGTEQNDGIDCYEHGSESYGSYRNHGPVATSLSKSLKGRSTVSISFEKVGMHKSPQIEQKLSATIGSKFHVLDRDGEF